MLAHWVIFLAVADSASIQALSRAHADEKAPPSSPREFLDDPYLPPSPRQPGQQPPAPSRSSHGVQVNVDASGANIPNDAANEPSIAIDPLNPQHIVIGWRQFDNISSNFRQAGHGHSMDGGRTWTFPGVFTPGTFRSDPILASDPDGRIFYYSLLETFLADMFISSDDGVTWEGPISARGGDKSWTNVDNTAGIGRGNIYAYWTSGVGCCGTRNFTRSTDHGQTYLNPVTLPSAPQWGTIAVGPDGEVYVVGTTSDGIKVTKSTNAQDPGVTPTFGTAVTVPLGGTLPSGGGPNPGGLSGQVWIATDVSAGPTRGNVYVLASVNPTGSDPLDVRFSRSTDGGATWSSSVRVNDDAASANAWQWFGTMSVAPNGRIDVIWNDTRESQTVNLSRTYYSFSTDAGDTWSTNAPLTEEWDSFIGYPQQNKIGDYYHMLSDDVGASLAYAATFNGEQDVYFLRIGDFDCNSNGVGDQADILAGSSSDFNGNGIPDECECLGDLNGDLLIDLVDLAIVLANYGVGTQGDFNTDGVVDLSDLAFFLTRYGAACR